MSTDGLIGLFLVVVAFVSGYFIGEAHQLRLRRQDAREHRADWERLSEQSAAHHREYREYLRDLRETFAAVPSNERSKGTGDGG